jgi:hypothetical protein
MLALQASAGNRAVASLLGAPAAPDYEGALPASVRDEMENTFGRSFGDVRIHQDGLAERRGATAVTTGSDVHLASGRFDPGSTGGRFLLAHELAHVVQQSGVPSAGAAAASAPTLADRELEGEADRAGVAAASGRRADVGARVHPRGAPVAQHFEEGEHKRIGELATGGPHGETKTVELAPGYYVPYGEMVAMAGDWFESIDQMRSFAAKPGPGEGTREEIDYTRFVKVNGLTGAASVYSDEAKEAVGRRFDRLAADNVSHFLAPGAGDAERPIAERANETVTRMVGFIPVRSPANAVAGYHLNHVRALVEAATAGGEKRPIDAALAVEAFADHYLTDAFSGGHVRTPRKSAVEYWDARVPMFPYNLQGYLAETVARDLSTSIGHYTTEGFFSGGQPKNWAGAFDTIGDKLGAQGAPLTFGAVVGLAIHAWDNTMGVRATVAGEEVTLYGDNHLGEGGEERLAVAAVRAGIAEVEAAYELGGRGIALADLPTAIKGPAPLVDELFAAEKMFPVATPDDELAPQPGVNPAVPWEFPTHAELLADPQFRDALKVFCDAKANALADLVKDQQSEVQDSVAKIVQRLKSDAAPDVVREIIDWTPDTGGGYGGHNEDDNAMDYIERASATQGGLASLTVPQRVRLMHHLFTGATFGDEEDAAYAVLTANPKHIHELVYGVSFVFSVELEEELGEDRVREALALEQPP